MKTIARSKAACRSSDGEMIGPIGVSSVQSSQDAQVAQAGVNALGGILR